MFSTPLMHSLTRSRSATWSLPLSLLLSVWLECSSGRLVLLIFGRSQPSLLVPATTLNIWLVLADLLVFAPRIFPVVAVKLIHTFSIRPPLLSPPPPFPFHQSEHYGGSGGQQSKWVVYFISGVKTHITWPSSGGNHLLSWIFLGKHGEAQPKVRM